MPDILRRRRYREDRVLIQSGRIIDPQFSDAVLFFSGAQIELMRNMTQYLQRLGTYVEEYNPGHYLTPDAEDWDSIQAIVADLENTLMGNDNKIWGFYSQLKVTEVGISIGDPSTIAVQDACAEGYIETLDHIMVYHNAGTTCSVSLQVMWGGADLYLFSAPALSSGEHVYLPVHVVLVEGQYVQWLVTGLPVDKLAVLRIIGTRMKL